MIESFTKTDQPIQVVCVGEVIMWRTQDRHGVITDDISTVCKDKCECGWEESKFDIERYLEVE